MPLPRRKPCPAYAPHEPFSARIALFWGGWQRKALAQAPAFACAALAPFRSLWEAHLSGAWHRLIIEYSAHSRAGLLAQRNLCERRLAELEQAYRQEALYLRQIDAALSATEQDESRALLAVGKGER